MGWAAKERTGRPAGGAGQHPQDRNAEEVSAACRALRPGEVFLLAPGSAASFDGRYFGPVPDSAVFGEAVPLWTW